MTRAPLLAAVALLGISSAARAQDAGTPTGAPPPDTKALVAAPANAPKAPETEKKLDGTTVSLSAGGQSSTGNSRLLALTANGTFETRFSNNGIGASVLANYGEGAPPGSAVVTTAENAQGRLRYDRYVIEQASFFLINTLRHDRFQGIDLRYNLDPGFKYLFLTEATNTLWAEAGYDLQYDVRRDDARAVLDANNKPVLNPDGTPQLLAKTNTDHSARLFAGYKHAFNKEVTLAAGIEYLQSFLDSERYRLNFDALAAAKIGGGLAFGVGFSARYDNAPLPGKEKLDTATTLSLIYAFSDVAEPPKEKTCPCPPEPPPPPPEAAPTNPPPPPTEPAPTTPAP